MAERGQQIQVGKAQLSNHEINVQQSQVVSIESNGSGANGFSWRIGRTTVAKCICPFSSCDSAQRSAALEAVRSRGPFPSGGERESVKGTNRSLIELWLGIRETILIKCS
jgi:hypothetical protein